MCTCTCRLGPFLFISISGGHVYGSRGELPLKVLDKRVTSAGHPNMNMIPDPSTFHDITWAGGRTKKTAEVLCNTYWEDGTPQESCSRFAAQKMLKKLDDMGYKLMSAFEIEFKVR